MLDLHTHVLPGIDDGPRSMAEALDLLRYMADEGVQHVVATPHIYPGVYDNTPELIAETFATLHAEVLAEALPLTMSWGAEVRLCPEMLDWLQDGRLPFLGKGTGGVRTVLIELPDGQVPVGADKLLARLRERNVQALIAHPERNRAIMESLDYLAPLIQAGAKVQLTAASLLGEFGEKALHTALKLLDTDWVAAVASDAHNLRGRKPRLAAARQWLIDAYGLARAEELTETSPAKLVGIGQLVFDGHDGVVLRDLTDDIAPGTAAQQDLSAFMLLDLPKSADTAGVPATGIEALKEDWSPSQAACWTDDLGALPVMHAEPHKTALDALLDTHRSTGADPLPTRTSAEDSWSLTDFFSDAAPPVSAASEAGQLQADQLQAEPVSEPAPVTTPDFMVTEKPVAKPEVTKAKVVAIVAGKRNGMPEAHQEQDTQPAAFNTAPVHTAWAQPLPTLDKRVNEPSWRAEDVAARMPLGRTTLKLAVPPNRAAPAPVPAAAPPVPPPPSAPAPTLTPSPPPLPAAPVLESLAPAEISEPVPVSVTQAIEVAVQPVYEPSPTLDLELDVVTAALDHSTSDDQTAQASLTHAPEPDRTLTEGTTAAPLPTMSTPASIEPQAPPPRTGFFRSLNERLDSYLQGRNQQPAGGRPAKQEPTMAVDILEVPAATPAPAPAPARVSAPATSNSSAHAVTAAQTSQAPQAKGFRLSDISTLNDRKRR